MAEYVIDGVAPDMSFLEMLDQLNEQLIRAGEEPVAFDHDCREGICGSCAMMIDGQAHGPERGATTCQLHMRSFRDGDRIVLEPWRAGAFPVVRDLVVDDGPKEAEDGLGDGSRANAGPSDVWPEAQVQAAAQLIRNTFLDPQATEQSARDLTKELE